MPNMAEIGEIGMSISPCLPAEGRLRPAVRNKKPTINHIVDVGRLSQSRVYARLAWHMPYSRCKARAPVVEPGMFMSANTMPLAAQQERAA